MMRSSKKLEPLFLMREEIALQLGVRQGTAYHSPDVAPSDFHLFGPFKNALRSRQFMEDEKLKDAVHG
jgi:hypothetical protein